MMQVYKRDDDGWYLCPMWIDQGQPIPTDCREDEPAGFYKAKRNAEDSGWVEGAMQEEIDTLKHVPLPKTEVQVLGEQLVSKDLEIIKLQDSLGKQIVNHDIRLMLGGL